ncbi:MAG TPA: hypothetical protein VN696_15075 [Pyrinomonadaceae bacterium]|nr:hypothetical protein [Pyrinomonadaceae bacterium]
MSPTNRRSPGPISDLEQEQRTLHQILPNQAHWFMTSDGRSPLSVSRDEFEFSVAHNRLMFSCWTESGSRTWRVTSWRWSDDKLVLEVSRRMGAETSRIELVPGASARAIVANIAAARQERCEQLAQIVAEFDTNAKVEIAKLSPGMRRDQPGRYARIILRQPHERIALTGIVTQSDVRNVDALFSSTLLWFQRVLASPKRPLVQRLLLVVEHDIVDAVRQRHVLLRDSLRDRIELLEIGHDWTEVAPVARFERKNLWRKRLTRFPPVKDSEISERANEIVDYAPQAIDLVASRHGQTLRFHGLPFARLRRVMNQDRLWFGIEGSRRRQLDGLHQPDWAKLFHDLETYRNEACRDRRHWLYRASGEAWLESILRRDITKIDPGLIIAPLYAQFRTSHGGAFGISGGARPIDLLALRHDGRLVVIELKVSEDRDHVFQGVDYWRRVEAHRRRGHIAAAKLFGDREISDDSPLVYLVAPALRFHPSFRTLAGTIAPDIEIYRFDINEDWRRGVRVVRRERVNA